MAHKTAEFDELVLKTIHKWKVPGLSIAVVEGDEIFAKGYGLATLHGQKCTNETIFDLASASKTITAAAVACLVDNKGYPNVQWTTSMSKLLPDDFVLEDPDYTKHVTVEDILSHRSGIPRHDESYLGIRARMPDNAKSMTRNLRNLPLNKPLRTTYQYNNIMYTVATHLIETLTGEKYADFIRTNIWEPLGMSDTYHDLPGIEHEPAKERLATGYRWDKAKGEYITIPSVSQPEGYGAGCIFSTATDAAKWVRALLRQTQPFSETTHEDLVTPRAIIPMQFELPFYSQPLYALGLIVETYRGRRVIGHDGDVTGFKAMIRYMPELDWGIVILGNSDGAFYAEQILSHVLMDAMLNVPENERVDWSKFWHDWEKDDEAESKKDEIDLKLRSPQISEPLDVPIGSLVGKYYNAGYKGLVLEMKDGKLFANCDDRGFPFVLRFTHHLRRTFVVESEDTWSGSTRKMKAEFRIGQGESVDALGMGLVEEMEDYFIWFTRVS
ncbi:beta-lactamase/transpeptidase-like protein [Pyrenochaeta sp. MPI-SDFR-AT-0127]|nr:beta-lactamase/transpeptidase-like protein [Pyrenochaeta sp. MPI-SDFR-AT-0127]